MDGAWLFLVIVSPIGFTLWVLVVASAAILVLIAIGVSRHLESVRSDRRRKAVQEELAPMFARFRETEDAELLTNELRPAILRMNAAHRPVAALLTIDLMHASSPAQRVAMRRVLESVGIVELGHRGTRRRSPWRRALACELLGEVGSPTSVQVLLQRLRDRRPEVRSAAVRALGRIGSTEALPALGEAFLERRVAPTDVVNDALRRIGGDAAAIFERGTATPDVTVRCSACFGLAALADQRQSAVWRLAEVLAHDSDTRVRAAAATALGLAGGTEVPGSLLAAANDPEITVRRSAVKSLGSFDDPISVRTLDERAEDEDREIALRAAESLIELSHAPHAWPEATALLESSSAWAVEYARIVSEVSS